MGKYRTSEILREWAIGEKESGLFCVFWTKSYSYDSRPIFCFYFHFFLYFIWFLFKFTKLVKQEPSLTFYFILFKIRVLLNIMR